MEENAQFQEKTKNSFQRVKEDIVRLEAELKQNKGVLTEIKIALENLTNKENTIKVPQEIKGSSTIVNDQRSTTINDKQSIVNNQSSTPIPISELKKGLDSTFLSLTDRELSVFMAVYNIDTEKAGEVSYYDLSQCLNLSDSTIRGCVNSLLRKGTPINKERFFNGKVSLSIKNEFKTLNLYEKLLKLKVSRQGQKTLFDI